MVLRLNIQEISIVKGEIITAAEMNALNDFGKKEEVNIQEFKNFKINTNNLIVKLPAKSVVALTIVE